MLPVQLTYGNEGFKEIIDFLKKNYHEDYTLSIYNNLEQSTIEVICDFDSMMDAALMIKSIEKNKDKVICCPEQIAYYKNWITIEQLQERAKVLRKNSYGKYLQTVVDETK